MNQGPTAGALAIRRVLLKDHKYRKFTRKALYIPCHTTLVETLIVEP